MTKNAAKPLEIGMTVSELNALVDEAVVLIAAGSWRAAKGKLIAANAGLAAMPDRRHGDAELKFDRKAIGELLKQVEAEARRVAGGGRMRVTGLEFVGDQ